MGISGFFPWLSRRCPRIISNVIEENEATIDCTQPNPNFQEFDNFYIDLNGIIHTCSHSEDRPAPKDEEEIFMLIFDYIDRLFAIVRPRKFLYIAIDGVAPRAKMNQQRSRRFRASKETEEKRKEIQNIRRKLESKGIRLPPPKEENFDPNCITPGTPFMARLANALRYFIQLRVTTNPAWQNIVIVFSDASVPGEGEHKIIDFIRRQQNSLTYDPTTTHCVCAPDADLIMLGLITHENNFNILRQIFVPNRPHPCELCFQYGHELRKCQGLSENETAEKLEDVAQTNFIFVRLPILREYLKWDLAMPNLPFEYDFERAVDDWVLLCFFVGNDFLPHLPSLEIHEGAIDRLVKLYKNVVYYTQGWLTDNGVVHVERVELIMAELGKVEDEIFRTRQEREEEYRAKKLSDAMVPRSPSLSTIVPYTVRQVEMKTIVVGQKRRFSNSNNDEPKSKLFKVDCVEQKLKVSFDNKSLITNHENVDPEDNIRFWENGWKDRYYRQKFGVSETDIQFRRQVAWAYTGGLCWIFKYYCHGCPSWDWYFPYHYAPFASDFDNISEFRPDWSKPTKPFYPLEQLMSVFPAASKLHIPAGWRELMTSPDSPIYKFYPTEFKIDLNGKKYASESTVILPFVDEKLLIRTLKSTYSTLTEDEKARNVVGYDYLFLGKRHPLFESIFKVYILSKRHSVVLNEQGVPCKEWIKIELNGLAGEICYDVTASYIGVRYPTLFPASEKFMDIPVNNCIMMAYKNPGN